jgi:hypothetical protein
MAPLSMAPPGLPTQSTAPTQPAGQSSPPPAVVAPVAQQLTVPDPDAVEFEMEELLARSPLDVQTQILVRLLDHQNPGSAEVIQEAIAELGRLLAGQIYAEASTAHQLNLVDVRLHVTLETYRVLAVALAQAVANTLNHRILLRTAPLTVDTEICPSRT